MMTKKIYLGLIFSSAMGGALVLPGCETAPPTQVQKTELKDDSVAAVDDLKAADPNLDSFLKNAAGYVIFPNVNKGGAGLGGGYGRGRVYEGNKFVGYADITMGTVGAQIGGATYSELIVFQTPEALQQLKNNKFQVEASANAFAVRAGASANAKYTNGVAIFIRTIGGLMADASVGGQNFTFTAAGDAKQ